MTPERALAFVKRHGVVLESARGAVPSLAEAIAGGPIRGSWWSHARGKAIFAATRAMREHADVLVCRIVDGKITFVHRRLWPALVRVADRIAKARLASVCEQHAATGKHVASQVAFPRWVPDDVVAAAHRLTVEDALAQLAPYVP